METNSILDQAEQRIAPAAATAHTRRTEMLDAMRDEIGRQHYQRAKDQLPEIERAIRNIYLPFLNRLATIAAKAKAPVPAQVQGWLREMDELCRCVPRQIRAGIEGWDTLAPPIWTDGKSLDVAVRGSLVHGIRTSLNSWDGCLTQLKNLTARADRIKKFPQHSRAPSGAIVARLSLTAED